jgi:hypothetical protein
MSAERTRDTADAVGLVTELIEAFNVADWPRFRATLDPGVTNYEPGMGRRSSVGDGDAADHGRIAADTARSLSARPPPSSHPSRCQRLC